MVISDEKSFRGRSSQMKGGRLRAEEKSVAIYARKDATARRSDNGKK
jgi:hypothetical protein